VIISSPSCLVHTAHRNIASDVLSSCHCGARTCMWSSASCAMQTALNTKKVAMNEREESPSHAHSRDLLVYYLVRVYEAKACASEDITRYRAILINRSVIASLEEGGWRKGSWTFFFSEPTCALGEFSLSNFFSPDQETFLMKRNLSLRTNDPRPSRTFMFEWTESRSNLAPSII
jgi:hypothetical protein